MKFVFGSELTSAIRTTMSEGRADIGVAFWGHNACDLIALPRDGKGFRVLCDAFSGACNPSAIKDLLSRHVEVRSISGFHAKVYIGDSRMVSCSANASANGLGEEAGEIEANLEAGFVSENEECREAARIWFDKLFARAKAVDDADLDAIVALWKKRRSDRPVRSPGLSLFDMMHSQDPTLEDRSIKIAVYTTEEIPADVTDRYKRSEYYRFETYSEEDPPYFWDAADWNVVVGDHLISFERDNEKVDFGQSWRVIGLIEKGGIVALEKVPDLFGQSLQSSDTRKVAKALTALIESRQIKADGPPLPIMDVARLMRRD